MGMALAVVGFLYMLALSTFTTAAQQRSPDELVGRVLAVNNAVLGALYPLGALIQGRLADVVGLRATTVAAAVVLAVALVAVRAAPRTSRPPLEHPVDPVPDGVTAWRAVGRTVGRWTSPSPTTSRRPSTRSTTFIEEEIRPLEEQDDNVRFFDHRREWARTDFEAGGTPRKEWEDLLREMRRRADRAGWLRLALPAEYGGRDATNLEMAIIREHLATKGLGLHNDLQNESSIVGNFPTVLMMRDFGTAEQKAEWMPGFLDGTKRLAFGLTEPNHGSDATYMETTAVEDGDEWVLNGAKRLNSGLHHATHDIVFARSSGEPGSPAGITAFLVPTDAPGFTVEYYWWTFNMPTDHAEVTLVGRAGAGSAVFGRGRSRARAGAALRAREPHPSGGVVVGSRPVLHQRGGRLRQRADHVGSPLSVNQGIQFPLVELHAEAAMLRQLVRSTAWMLDQRHHMEVTHLVAMCNYRANRLACDAADRAMQTCGGVGYSRHMPFEHIYRHHRRYRITEGSEEIQMRKVAQQLFGFGRRR